MNIYKLIQRIRKIRRNSYGYKKYKVGDKYYKVDRYGRDPYGRVIFRK